MDARALRVAVYGGSFNPPHMAHVLAVTYVLGVGLVDRVLVVPAYRHPFAKMLAPYDVRVAMCEQAMGWLPNVEISRVEEALGGESRTLRTVEHLRAQHPRWELRLVIGSDILLEAHKWFGFERISEVAPLLVLGRVGYGAVGAPPAVVPAFSSSEIRQACARRDWDRVQPMLPAEVLATIRTQSLYARAAE